MSWINEKMSNLDEKIADTEMELNVLGKTLKQLASVVNFWIGCMKMTA